MKVFQTQTTERARQFAVFFFFLSWLLVGLAIVDDYGVTWDEPVQRLHGIVSYNHVLSKLGINPDESEGSSYRLDEYSGRHYGVLFSLPMYGLERLLGLDEFREYHLLRHVALFFLFWLATVVFYRLLLRQFQNKGWAMLGAVMLILSPRIFAHAFFNVKDSVLLSFFVYSLATLFVFLDRPNIKTMLLHALVCGMTVSVRNVGMIAPMLSVFWVLLYSVCCHEKHERWYVCGKLLPGFIAATIVFVFLFWPSLWENPYARFTEAYKVMANYPNVMNVLFFGKLYLSVDLPWYYIPGWFVITVPVPYLFLGIVSICFGSIPLVLSVLKFDGKWIRDRESRLLVISLSFFLLPWIAVIIKGSTLYDGWRQLYFIYPPFVILCVIGARIIERILYRWQNKNGLYCFRFLVFISFSVILWKMIAIHPQQQVYFNLLAGGNRLMRFELDYWGASYRQGLETLLERDDNQCVTVKTSNPAGYINILFLPEEQQERICFQDNPADHADYYLTNFRDIGGKNERQLFQMREGVFGHPFFFIEVEGTPILGVFRGDPDNVASNRYEKDHVRQLWRQ